MCGIFYVILLQRTIMNIYTRKCCPSWEKMYSFYIISSFKGILILTIGIPVHLFLFDWFTRENTDKVIKEETFSDTSFLSYHWERNRNKWLEILNASNNLQKEECYRNLEGIFNLIWNYILNTCTNKNTMEKKRLAGHDIQQDNSNLKYKNIWIEIYGNLFIQKLNC